MDTSFQSLPQQLALQLINIQLEIGVGNVQRSVIQKAVAIYTEAIQYNVNRSQVSASDTQLNNYIAASRYYQSKLQNFLRDQEINQCLLNQTKTSYERKRINSCNVQKNIKEEVNKALINNQQNAEMMMKKYRETRIAHKRLVRRQIQDQNQAIKERLSRRIKSISFKKNIGQLNTENTLQSEIIR